MAGADVDVVITEIGGTVGDIESLPFLEAARQVRHDVGRDNVFFLHVSLVPYIGPSRRAEDQADPALGRRAALDRHPARRHRLPRRPRAPDVDQAQDLADVRRRRGGRRHRGRRAVDLRHPEGAAPRGPRRLRRAPARPARSATSTGPSGTTCCAGCTTRTRRSRSRWSASTSTCPTPTSRSPRRCGPAASPTRPRSRSAGSPPTSAQTPEGARATSPTSTRSACPAASASAASRASSARSTYARTHSIPTLGLCLGLQCMVIEYARNVAGLEKAGSTEFDPGRPEPVIATMAEQLDIVEGAGDLGGTMRLGPLPGRRSRRARSSRAAYGAPQVEERHRHRYEVNNAYRDQLEEAGLVFSGHLAGQQPGRVRRAARATCTRTTSRPRRTPSCGRARPGRTRSSPGWSAPRSQRQRELLLPDRRERAATRGGRRGRGAEVEPRPRGASQRVGDSARPRVSVGRRSASWPVGTATCTATTGWWRCARTRSSAPATPTRSRSAGWCSSTPAPWSILAVDDDERVLLPVAVPPRRPAPASSSCPAGLCDVAGEEPVEVARRELRRGGRARRPPTGRHLGTTYSSPGITAERLHFFLARGLTDVDRGDFELEHEEAEMEIALGAVRRPARGGARRRVSDGHTAIAVLLAGARV